MAVSEHSKEYPFAEEEEEYSESEGSHSDHDSDDSDKDPSYTILEKTSAKFSNLSIKNNIKSKARFVSSPYFVNGFFWGVKFWFSISDLGLSV